MYPLRGRSATGKEGGKAPGFHAFERAGEGLSKGDFSGLGAQLLRLEVFAMRNIGLALAAALALSFPAAAKSSAKAEVHCADGSLSKAGRGTCSRHGGVQEWLSR